MADELSAAHAAPRSPGAAPKKNEKPPEPGPALKCADCGKAFKGYSETRWDVHVGGGVYKTVCTSCFEKQDSQWPDPTAKGAPPEPAPRSKRR